MTPSEFKQARNTLGLSQIALATILNSDPRTIRKWEAEDGTRPPPSTACRVMRWMLDGYRPPEWPRSKSGGPSN